jgi:hypothetical protein
VVGSRLTGIAHLDAGKMPSPVIGVQLHYFGVFSVESNCMVSDLTLPVYQPLAPNKNAQDAYCPAPD